ncbi:thioredoxin [Paenibacillus sp. BR2-3]|uniref:thioredoxin n=1 Tax=Paenibacillus sp. BR2-3 TaxID=3048494 RepID=UPI0039779692
MAIMSADNADMLSEELQQGGTVLVDYGAPWCAPCKVLLPLLEELHQEFGDAVSIVKVNCDELPQLAAEAGVMSMPTVIVYKEGQPMEKLVGLRPKAVYQSLLNKHLTSRTII